MSNPSYHRLDLVGFLWAFAAAGLWGTLGIAGKWLLGFGVAPLPLMAVRATIAAAVLGFILLLVRVLRWIASRYRRSVDRSHRVMDPTRTPASLRIHWRDVIFFALYGLVSVALNYLAYFLALDYLGATLAATLFYTYPVLATLLASALFGERLTLRRALPLPVTFLGCALLAGLFSPTEFTMHPVGIVWGLVAATTFALYAIFGRYALSRHTAWAALFYSIAFGALFLDLLGVGLCVLLPSAGELCSTLPHLAPDTLPFWGGVLYLALGPTLGAYLSYLQSLRRLEVRQASLVTTLELVITVILASLIFQERLTLAQWLGAALILSAVLWLRTERRS